MATVAYNCDEEPGDAGAAYTPAPNCLDEGATAVGLIAIKKGFNIKTLITTLLFNAAVTAKDIILIRDVTAFWPAGTPVKVPSSGGRPDRLVRIDYTMAFSYEGVDANLHFQNALNHSRDYGLGFVSEEFKLFSPQTRELDAILCNFWAQPTAEQEYGKNRYMAGEIAWKGKDLVYLIDEVPQSVLKAAFQA